MKLASVPMFRRTASLIVLLPLLGRSANAQAMPLTVAVFDGKSGKPLPTQRLVVFAGMTQEEVSLHKRTLEVTTGKDGMGTLRVEGNKDRWIQVFVAFHTLCQPEPNAIYIDVERIVAAGHSTLNACGPFNAQAMPKRLNVYARTPTLREKMGW